MGFFIGMKFKKLKVNKKKIIVAIATLLVVGSFLAFKARSKKELSTTTVQKGTVKEELVLSGTVKAEKDALLNFPTSGKIVWVGVVEGQKVYRGQGLTSLDKTVLNTIYQQALNTYKEKQAAAEKVEDDVKGHSGDETFAQKSTRTTAQVARDNAYDSVIASEYNLRNATLVAPFNGVIASLTFPNPWVNVSAADTQIEIVDPASIYFEVEADQTEVVSLKNGQEATILLDAFSSEEYIGKVTFVGLTPKIGEAGTVYKVKVKFENPQALNLLARIGMTGDARFILSQKENVLTVPSQFVNSDKTGRFVYLGKKRSKTPVDVGIEGEEKTEILKGVKEGDLLYD